MLDEGLIETTETADHFCLINNDDIRPHIKRVPTEGDDGVLKQHIILGFKCRLYGRIFTRNIP